MGNVKLSKRLQSVVSMLDKTTIIADIGCDHAHSSIYLIQNSVADKVIAMDINKGPLEKAANNLKLYNCEDSIELRLSDGARKLNVGEVDSILISGMGGRLIEKIMCDSEEVIRSLSQIVLSPQSEIYLVRRRLLLMGFVIVKEDMLIDEGKYYVVIKAVNKHLKEPKLTKDITEKELYGEYLLDTRNEILKRYLEHEYDKVCKVIKDLSNRLADSEDEKIKTRLEVLKLKKKDIEKGMTYYEM